MSGVDYDMESIDIHTFDPVPRRRRMARPVISQAPQAKAPRKATEPMTSPVPDLMEALLEEVAARRAGMAELERRIGQLSHELRRIRQQDEPAVRLRFTPAAGFGKMTL